MLTLQGKEVQYIHGEQDQEPVPSVTDTPVIAIESKSDAPQTNLEMKPPAEILQSKKLKKSLEWLIANACEPKGKVDEDWLIKWFQTHQPEVEALKLAKAPDKVARRVRSALMILAPV